MTSNFNFPSGLPDCCSSNPDSYKVLCEIEGNARLVEMTLRPGEEDTPHDHPKHCMFFITGAKLQITPYGSDGKKAGEPEVKEIPAGFAPIFPPGAHQVKNVGTSEVKVLFVEAYPTFKPSGDVAGYISPCDVAKDCYKILAEDDDWITVEINIAPGKTDGPAHYHRDHLIYVLEGEQGTIFPGGDLSAGMPVDLTPGMGIPAPMSAPPFAKHIVKNSGATPLRMIYFETKN
jgi:mannose-6-phosphate isomerase-like protein (cupin superfamily)